jgi:hypothetical protein
MSRRVLLRDTVPPHLKLLTQANRAGAERMAAFSEAIG